MKSEPDPLTALVTRDINFNEKKIKNGKHAKNKAQEGDT